MSEPDPTEASASPSDQQTPDPRPPDPPANGASAAGEQPVYRWSPRTRRTVAMFIAILAGLVLWGAREIVGPFVWAGIFAYVFNPAVNGLVRLARVPRPAAVAIFYALGIGLLTLLGFLIIPRVVDELDRLTTELPSIIADLETALPAEFLGQPLVVQDVIDGLTAGATSMLTDASQAVSAFRSAFNLLIHGVLAVVAAGYLLLAGPELFRGLLERIPPGPRTETEELIVRINSVLGGFIRGEIILVVIMSVTTFIGLSIIGIPFAVILAIATGFLELIPVFGPIMAAIPPIGLALVTANNFGWPGWVAGVVVAVMYTVLRQLEDYFVIPNVVGRVVRVHPLIALFAIFAGLQIWGITGMVIALPVAGVARVLLGYAYRRTVTSPRRP
ncbi:MAG: AI-2E family transporter [Chloroflexota bacterium]|nr:AI-2E family transporter [Chloroflexota bacterium]